MSAIRIIIKIFFFCVSIPAFTQEKRLYIKPQLNFQFPLVKTIRQDELPYASIQNNHRQAAIMAGVRFEFLKPTGNGYFFNFGTVPVGYAVKYRDYALIDWFYGQRLPSAVGAREFSSSSTGDVWAFDFGFISRLATVSLFKKLASDVKFGYGITLASFRPGYFVPSMSEWINAEGKRVRFSKAWFPIYDPDKSHFGIMVPLKLDFNIKQKLKNVERLNFEVAYWHSFKKFEQFKFDYYNITDDIRYENVVQAKGTAWQLSIHIPLRIRKIGKQQF